MLATLLNPSLSCPYFPPSPTPNSDKQQSFQHNSLKILPSTACLANKSTLQVKERNEMHTHATAKIYYYIETLRTSFITCTKSASAFAHRQNGFHKVKCMIMVFNACIPDQSKKAKKKEQQMKIETSVNLHLLQTLYEKQRCASSCACVCVREREVAMFQRMDIPDSHHED